MERQPGPSAKNQQNLKTSSAPRRLRFGAFEVDLTQRELRLNGTRVTLQQKPFQVLELLLEHPGELVSRARLAKFLWPDLHVGFDGSLNTAVNALRHALNDSPQQSRFIETRPGLGYRFLADVDAVGASEDTNDRKSAAQLAESVMAAVAGALNLPPMSLSRRVQKPGSTDREAYSDYRRGRYLLDRCNEQDLVRSQACFEAALARDPTSATAYSGLADAHSMAAFLGVAAPGDAHVRATQAAERALRLDDRSADAHCALGYVKSLFEWDWAGAEAAYLQALTLDDECVRAHQLYANLLALTGRLSEAVQEIKRALDLDPVSNGASLEAAWILYVAADFEEAAAHAWNVLTLEPRLAHAQYLLGLVYEQLHRFEDAVTEFENSRMCFGIHAANVAALGHTWALMGDRVQARAKLNELDHIGDRAFVSLFWRGILHTGLGEHASALAALESSFAQRDVWLPWLNADPRFAPLRSSRRFQILVKNLEIRG